MKKLFLIPFVLICQNITAQYQLNWATYINGLGDSTEYCYDFDGKRISLGSDSAIYTAGTTLIGSDEDILLSKVSNNGNIMWQRQFDGGLNKRDVVAGTIIDKHNNFYIVGSTQISQNDYDYLILKYDSAGNLKNQYKWSSQLNGGIDVGADISIDSLGYVFVCGINMITTYQFTTIKLSPTLTKMWEYSYNGLTGAYQYPNNIATDNQGFVYMTCQSKNTINNNDDCGLIKLDTSGNFQWLRTYNGSQNGADYIYDLAIDKLGNPVYVGNVSQGSGTAKFLTIKYTPVGNVVFANEYAHPTKLDQTARCIAVDANGNIYVTGETNDITTTDILTLKFSQIGNFLWAKTFTGNYSTNIANDNEIDGNGNLLITGRNSSAYYQKLLHYLVGFFA